MSKHEPDMTLSLIKSTVVYFSIMSSDRIMLLSLMTGF